MFSSAPTKDFMDFPFHPIPFIATTLAVILAFCIIKIVAGRSPEKKKRYHPIGGTIFHQLLNFHRLYDYQTDLASKHKTYRLLSPFRSEVYTSDPANVEYILKSNFENYGKVGLQQSIQHSNPTFNKISSLSFTIPHLLRNQTEHNERRRKNLLQGWYNYNILKDLLGDGIFTVDGEKWRHQRRVSSYEFSTKILRDFSSAVFRSNAVKLAQIVSEAATSKQAIEIQDLFTKSTLDIVVKVILGVELDSMCGTSEEGTRLSNSFDEASAITQYRYVDFFWKIKRFLNIGSEALLRDRIKVVDEYVYKLIKSKTEHFHKSQDDSPMKKGDILSRLLELEGTDPKYLKDMIISFITAGKDSTTTTLSWFLYMLCKHPHIQEKIAQEVREAINLKDDLSFDELAASMTEEALDKIHYLHAALTETLRLYPALPVGGRVCFSDDTWPDGFSVRKGDLVFFQPYAMGRMKFLWGDDAEDFRPERWLDENGIFRQESPFKFIAFQAGPRICLGKEFAYMQMKIFSAVLLGSFMFKLSDEKKKVNYKIMLTLHIDGGLHLCAFQRLHGSSIDA